jgi:hypothetical protein
MTMMSYMYINIMIHNDYDENNDDDDDDHHDDDVIK